MHLQEIISLYQEPKCNPHAGDTETNSLNSKVLRLPGKPSGLKGRSNFYSSHNWSCSTHLHSPHHSFNAFFLPLIVILVHPMHISVCILHYSVNDFFFSKDIIIFYTLVRILIVYVHLLQLLVFVSAILFNFCDYAGIDFSFDFS